MQILVFALSNHCAKFVLKRVEKGKIIGIDGINRRLSSP